MAVSSIFRTLAHRGPLTFVAGLGGLVAQGYYAGHRLLPHFLDQDGSGSFGPTDAVPIRLVAIGDSMLTGPGLIDPEDQWIRQAIERLPDLYRVELVVLARGGSRTRDIRREQLDDAMALKPDVAIISAGSNDAIRGVSLRVIRADIEYMAGSLATVASTVMLTGVGDMGAIPRIPQPLAAACSWRSWGADRVHAQVAARRRNIVNLPMWEEGSEPFRADPNLFTSDLFHPNADGQAVWADLGYPVIAAAFRKSTRGER